MLLSSRTDKENAWMKLVAAFSIARKVFRLGHMVEPLTSFWRCDSTWDGCNAILSVLNDLSDDVVCLSKIKFVDGGTGVWCEWVSNWLWMICILMDLNDVFCDYRKSSREHDHFLLHSNSQHSNVQPLRQSNSHQSNTHQSLQPLQSNTQQPLQLYQSKTHVDSEWTKKNSAMVWKLSLKRVSCVKILCDFAFCLYDVRELTVFPAAHAFFALLSASCGAFKLVNALK